MLQKEIPPPSPGKATGVAGRWVQREGVKKEKTLPGGEETRVLFRSGRGGRTLKGEGIQLGGGGVCC